MELVTNVSNDRR